LGYQLIARLSLGAVVSLGSSAIARAGTIAGAIAFPSQIVPPTTVYASDIDTPRVHSVQLERGQTSFSVEVPPGRYWVFLAPNEPGAPNIYGAYTRYSLCASQAADHCDDHALVPVVVSARTPHAAVTIDDWYLSDDVADQIDRIRGVAAGADSQPLSAPRFSEYPSAAFDGAAPPKVDFGGSETSEEDRAHVQQALLGGPNFAGHVTATRMMCGPGCGRLLLVDWQTGLVQQWAPWSAPGAHGDFAGTLPCRHEEALQFRRDSRLLSITYTRGAAVVTQYFVWNPQTGALAQSGEYQLTAQAFCGSPSIMR
jgi:hypothetical protein